MTCIIQNGEPVIEIWKNLTFPFYSMQVYNPNGTPKMCVQSTSIIRACAIDLVPIKAGDIQISQTSGELCISKILSIDLATLEVIIEFLYKGPLIPYADLQNRPEFKDYESLLQALTAGTNLILSPDDLPIPPLLVRW